MKYLGIIIDNKFKFSEHISYAAEGSSKLIHSLSKSAELTWGLNYEALKTIYNGAILPLLLYGSPVWAEAMSFKYNRLKYIRVSARFVYPFGQRYRWRFRRLARYLSGGLLRKRASDK